MGDRLGIPGAVGFLPSLSFSPRPPTPPPSQRCWRSKPHLPLAASTTLGSEANKVPSHGTSMCGASKGNTPPGITVTQALETHLPQEHICGYLRGWNQIDYILCSQSWRSSIQSTKTRLGADCGSDHELLIAKFRLKLKKVGRTTRPFRYDLNQIPYDYTVEVRNTFMGLDLIDCLMNYGRRFVTVYRRQGSRPSPWKTNAKKAKWLSGEALQIAVKRREEKSRGEKE